MKVTLELDCLSTETRHAIASETENSEVLDVLSADEKSYVRCTVANNEHVSEETLDKLANDESDQVRWEVAENSNTSFKTLENWLMICPAMYVERWLAMKMQMISF